MKITVDIRDALSRMKDHLHSVFSEQSMYYNVVLTTSQATGDMTPADLESVKNAAQFMLDIRRINASQLLKKDLEQYFDRIQSDSNIHDLAGRALSVILTYFSMKDAIELLTHLSLTGRLENDNIDDIRTILEAKPLLLCLYLSHALTLANPIVSGLENPNESRQNNYNPYTHGFGATGTNPKLYSSVY